MTSTSLEKIRSGEEFGVNVGAIEKELANLWRTASIDAAKDGQSLSRACSWNLAVHVADDDHVGPTKALIDEILRAVPSRALLLKPRPNATGPEVEAYISANCQVESGGKKLLCTEEITLESHGRGGELLPSLMRSLLVPDVPTALWWAGAAPTDPGAVRALLSGVDRLVFDSSSAAREGGLAKLAAVAGIVDGLQIADLCWLRTAPLRTSLASLFDPPIGGSPLTRLKRVRVDVREDGVAAAKLLLAWLASRLSWGAPERQGERGALSWSAPRMGGNVRIDIVTGAPCTRKSGVANLVLQTDQGEQFALIDDGENVSIEAPDMPVRTIVVREHSTAELLTAALGVRGRDRLYAVALHRAVELDR